MRTLVRYIENEWKFSRDITFIPRLEGVYIGETMQHLETRLKHKNDIRNRSKSTALRYHASVWFIIFVVSFSLIFFLDTLFSLKVCILFPVWVSLMKRIAVFETSVLHSSVLNKFLNWIISVKKGVLSLWITIWSVFRM